MREGDQTPEWITTFEIVGSALILYGLANGAFAFRLKQEAKKRNGRVCEECGEVDPRVESHHRVPQSLGGADNEANLVLLCGPNFNDCHEKYDELALNEHIIFPGIPIENVGDKLFRGGKNPYKRRR